MLLVGTDDGLRRLDEGGDELGIELGGQEVRAIAPDGSGWWALADGEGLWRSLGSGSWDMAAAVPGASGNCLWSTSAGLLVGTGEAGLLRFTDGSLQPVESFEQVKGRSQWYTPWGGPPDSRSISAGSDGAIYVNVHVGGIVRSGDAGRTWEPTIDIDADVHQVLAPEGRPGLVLAASAVGLAVSEDGGDSWKYETKGLHGTYLRAVAFTEGMVFVTASEGHRGRQAAVYVRPFADEGPFTKCTQGLPDWFTNNIDTFCLAASGPLAAFGTDQGSVFVSKDQGSSWREIAAGLPPVRCLTQA
jgi:hypothetical protein